jgi:hypothetical protein
LEPLVFLHNPKAGGTSITDALRGCYDPREIAPTLESAPHERRRAAWGRVSRCRFVAGHFGHEVAARHFPGHALITNFRHPVARIVSLYDFWRRSVDPGLFRWSDRSGPAHARRLTFAEFVRSDSPFLSLYVADFHTRQILESGWTKRTIDAGDMSLAKERTAAMRWFYVCEFEHQSLAWLGEAFPAVVAGRGALRVRRGVSAGPRGGGRGVASRRVAGSGTPLPGRRVPVDGPRCSVDPPLARVSGSGSHRAVGGIGDYAAARTKNEFTSREPS